MVDGGAGRATIGVIGGEVTLLGIVALPQMLRLGYDRKLAIGCDLRRRRARLDDPAELVLVFSVSPPTSRSAICSGLRDSRA